MEDIRGLNPEQVLQVLKRGDKIRYDQALDVPTMRYRERHAKIRTIPELPFPFLMVLYP